MFSSVSQITDSIYLSSFHPVRPERLRQLGIELVVNCTIEIPCVRAPGVEAIQLHLDDTPFSNIKAHFDRVGDKLIDVVTRGGKALVHCVAGVSRSAAIVIAYLMKHKRLPLREAFTLVRSRRPFIRPNVGFWRQLIDYEQRLFGSTSVRMIDSPIGQIPDVYREEARSLFWGSPTYSYSNGSGATGLSLNGLSIGNSSSSSSNSSALYGSSSGSSSGSGSLYSSGTGSLLGTGSFPSSSASSTSPSSSLSHSASTSNLSLLGRERAAPSTLPLALPSDRSSERERGVTTSTGYGRRESSSLAMSAPLRHASSNSSLLATSYSTTLRSSPRYSSTFYRLGF